MNKKPFFSVVIPLYNKEKYIKRTLTSVLNQSFTNFEIVIVDDGSRDTSCNIVESINDPRIHLIHQENGGPSKARNRGIKEANGEFVAFLDADDEWLPYKLEKQYKFHIENPNSFWSCTAFKASGGKREEHIGYVKDGVIDDTLDAIMDGMTIQTSTVVIKTNIFKNDRLLFNESFKRSEDREVWYKTACLYPSVGYLKEELLIYYVETDGSLNATGFEEADFSFLSLSERIKKELSGLDIGKRKRFLNYLQYLTVSRMLTLWGWKHSFKEVSKHFEPYIDTRVIRLLLSFDFMPLLIKKVIVKIYLVIKNLFI